MVGFEGTLMGMDGSCRGMYENCKEIDLIQSSHPEILRVRGNALSNLLIYSSICMKMWL